MSSYTRIRKRLERKPFLVVDSASGSVEIVSEREKNEHLKAAAADPFHSCIIMNAHQAAKSFANLEDVGEADKEFTMHEIAKIAGVKYTAANLWVSEGVLTPSVRPSEGPGRGKDRLFSWNDAFAAGICGSLRRQGAGLDMLRKVSRKFESKRVKVKQ